MSITITKPADATFIAYGEPSWVSQISTTWVGLPSAKIPLSLGGLDGSNPLGATYVATFSAEAIAESENGVAFATIFFGDTAAEPASDNHRFVSSRGDPEWSSHTFIRVISFDRALETRDVTAEVRFIASDAGGATKIGIQNWVLKIERFNL